MPSKETAAARKEREALEREEEQKRKEAFQATVPLQLLKLLAKAQARHDVETSVYDDPVGGVRVKFSFPPMAADFDTFGGDERVEFTAYHLANDPYEIQAIEGHFEKLEQAALAAARERKIAQDAYDNLSPEARKALGLHRRP
jgi:hypothetical protein